MKCPHCQGELARDWEWQPETGYDPHMKKYSCPDCRRDIYITRATPMPKDVEKVLDRILSP